MSSAAYHFLPWVRSGMPASITTPDSPGATLLARASIPVTVRLASSSPGQDTEIEDVNMPLRIYGPGDVIGIDPREVVRTEPNRGTPDFPPHLLAAIEFDRPDFPWLFTPAAPDSDRLRPWIVLVVVSQATAGISQEPNRPLPTLECPLDELPDLAYSRLWAHAQFTGAKTADDGMSGALSASPNQAISRLICPRRLEPGGGAATGYLACLVPAFEIGRKAGLGGPITSNDEATLAPAWDVNGTAKTVTLPVYYSWEFSTAPTEGDFEDLVDQIRMPGASDAPEPALMDMSEPGRDLPEIAGATLGLPSALQRPGVTPSGWPDGLAMTLEEFQGSLEQELQTPHGQGSQVAPPIYGAIQALGIAADAGRRLDQVDKPWLQEINRDPRYRVAAALGAQVVRDQQEQLVSSAWRQAGEAAEANRWLARKQLAREVTLSIYENRLKVLSPGSLQQVTAPVMVPAAVPVTARLAPRMTAFATAGETSAPEPVGAVSDPLVSATASAAFRRIARPEGPLARHTAAATVTDEPLATVRTTLGALMTELVEAPALATLKLMSVAETLSPTTLQAATLTTASTLTRATTAPVVPAAATAELLRQLDPNLTFALEATARIDTTAPASSSHEPLATLRVTPTFPQPMYEPLRDMFRDMLLPGLDDIPNNSVLLLKANPAFIEAYMAGLNDGLSRELLWREFPTDLRGTYFRQFWDVRAQLSEDSTDAEREALSDIPPIANWTAPLGKNVRPDRGENLMLLLIKGDLLLRFPTAVIFAARAKWPEVNGTLVPPVDRAGNALPEKAGWFFVIQEHPFETRFGLNSNRTDALTTWRKLAWTDIGLRGDSSYIDPTGVVPKLGGTIRASDKLATWGRTGADMAYITLQQAYRLEVHAGHWLS
jgi:hypothetical protein